jgi:hypothetical protein
MQMEAQLRALLLGRLCIEVLKDDETQEWVFAFDGLIALRAICPWRIIAGQRLVYGYEDHGQQFGLPAPIDGRTCAGGLLSGRPICGIHTRDVSGDLSIEFDGGTWLELFNSSGGYEGWQCSTKDISFIGMGGGSISRWTRPDV